MPVRISWPAVGATLLPNIGGILGGFFVTRKNLHPWYDSLNKPAWRPPNWAFGPVWTGLYCSMGYASYLVWESGSEDGSSLLPLSIYAANLALNWSWTPIFFGAHKIGLALCEISALWLTTAATAITFYRVNPVAGYLIVPYLGWMSLATALNYVVYRDNPRPAIEDKKQ